MEFQGVPGLMGCWVLGLFKLGLGSGVEPVQGNVATRCGPQMDACWATSGVHVRWGLCASSFRTYLGRFIRMHKCMHVCSVFLVVYVPACPV